MKKNSDSNNIFGVISFISLIIGFALLIGLISLFIKNNKLEKELNKQVEINIKYINKIHDLNKEMDSFQNNIDTIIVKDIQIQKIIEERGLKYEEDIKHIDGFDIADNIKLFSKYTK